MRCLSYQMCAASYSMHQQAKKRRSTRYDFWVTKCAINKTLMADLWWQARQLGALFCNEAKSCYDHIAHSNVAVLCMQCLGLLPETCHVMIGTLDQVKHYVALHYCWRLCFILFRSWNPTARHWPRQSCHPHDLAGQRPRLCFQNANTDIHDKFEFVCITFVDDTDLVHLPSNDTTSQRLLAYMQQVLNHWEGGLCMSGAGLYPS